MTLEQFVSSATVRARVAFVLALADYGLCIFDGEISGLAKQAMQASWRWEEVGDVSAKTLHEFVESSEQLEGGLILEVDLANQKNSKDVALLAATTDAVAYVARQAYLAEHENHLPGLINEAGDDIIPSIVEHVAELQKFDYEVVWRLTSFLTDRCGGAVSNELGRPVKRTEVLSVAYGRELKR